MTYHRELEPSVPLRRLSRRAWLREGTLVLAGSGVMTAAAAFAVPQAPPPLRIGLVADIHHADRDTAGSRHYRESLAKYAEAAQRFAAEGAALQIALGDSIDSAASLEAEKGHLQRVVERLAAGLRPSHFVVGNHCVNYLTKREFLDIVGQEQSFYAFDQGGYHFVLLDACFRSDGVAYARENFTWTDANIPPDQLAWLRDDLASTDLPTLVCVHQRLDAEPPYGIGNAAEVRQILEDSGKVRAVLQGHYHPGDYRELGGIHYATLMAMVEGSGEENSAYAILDLFADGQIRLTGFRRQPDLNAAIHNTFGAATGRER